MDALQRGCRWLEMGKTLLSKLGVPADLKRTTFYQSARMAAFKLAGRNSMCSISEGVEGHATARYFDEVLSGFLSDSRLVERDPVGLSL